MKSECIIAEFEDAETARLGLEVLAKAGYGADHVSIVTRHDHPALKDGSKPEQNAADSKEVASSAGVGGVLGGALAIPLAASTLLGPLILVGPIVGMGIGALLGGMLGSTTNDKSSKDNFHETVEQGGVLLVVTGSNADLIDAQASVKTAGPIRVTRLTVPHEESPDGTLRG